MPAKSKRSISELLKSSKAQKFLKSDLSIDLIGNSYKIKEHPIFETSLNQTSEFQTTPKPATTTIEKSLFQTTVNQTSENETTEIKTSKKNTPSSRLEGKKNLKPMKSEIQTSGFRTTESLGLSFGGFLPLACCLFEPRVFTDLKPGEIKLLLYLLFLRWRYPERPGYIRAALPYLERGTGIARSAVHTHLKRLSELGLIRCGELNKKIGNLYFVSDSFLWKTSEKQTTEIQTSEKQTSVVWNSDVSSLKNVRQSSGFHTKELDLLDPLDSSKLSLSADSVVGRYLAAIKATQKRESEKRFLVQLMRGVPVLQIEEAISFLQTEGTLNGEICHSPLSYLSKAGDQVFSLLETKKAQAMEMEKKKITSEKQAALEQEKIEHQKKLREDAWVFFRERHPEPQLLESKLTQLIEARISKDKFTAPREILQTLVVIDWYDAQVKNGSYDLEVKEEGRG